MQLLGSSHTSGLFDMFADVSLGMEDAIEICACELGTLLMDCDAEMPIVTPHDGTFR